MGRKRGRKKRRERIVKGVVRREGRVREVKGEE